MNKQIEIEIKQVTIKVGDVMLKLSLAEAKQLRDKLEQAFPYPYVRNYPYTPSYPFTYGTGDLTTISTNVANTITGLPNLDNATIAGDDTVFLAVTA